MPVSILHITPLLNGSNHGGHRPLVRPIGSAYQQPPLDILLPYDPYEVWCRRNGSNQAIGDEMASPPPTIGEVVISTSCSRWGWCARTARSKLLRRYECLVRYQNYRWCLMGKDFNGWISFYKLLFVCLLKKHLSYHPQPMCIGLDCLQ